MKFLSLCLSALFLSQAALANDALLDQVLKDKEQLVQQRKVELKSAKRKAGKNYVIAAGLAATSVVLGRMTKALGEGLPNPTRADDYLTVIAFGGMTAATGIGAIILSSDAVKNTKRAKANLAAAEKSLSELNQGADAK